MREKEKSENTLMGIEDEKPYVPLNKKHQKYKARKEIRNVMNDMLDTLATDEIPKHYPGYAT